MSLVGCALSGSLERGVAADCQHVLDANCQSRETAAGLRRRKGSKGSKGSGLGLEPLKCTVVTWEPHVHSQVRSQKTMRMTRRPENRFWQTGSQSHLVDLSDPQESEAIPQSSLKL